MSCVKRAQTERQPLIEGEEKWRQGGDAVFENLSVSLPSRPVSGEKVRVRVAGGFIEGVVMSVFLTEDDAAPAVTIGWTESEPEDFGKAVGQFESDSRWKCIHKA